MPVQWANDVRPALGLYDRVAVPPWRRRGMTRTAEMKLLIAPLSPAGTAPTGLRGDPVPLPPLP
jgi:hypothetical protein